MAITLDATVGGASANTYVTQANATTYFEGHAFASTWTAATSANQDIALAHATRILDRVKWAGTKAASTQALAFPREYCPTLEFDAQADVVAEFFIDETTAYYSSTAIPTPLVRATCELALELLKAGTSDPFEQDASRIRSETVGPISTEWFDSQDAVRGISRFPHVIQLVEHMMRTGTNGLESPRA